MTRNIALRLLGVTSLAAGVLLACSGSGGPRPDAEISLRREALLQVTTPAPVRYALADPGESQRLPRAYYGAPPMIPHTVADMVLDAGTNDCLDCHEEGDADTPGISPSHRVKAQYLVVPRAEAQHGMTTVFTGFANVDTVSGNRYDCRLCHAIQATGATELVPNDFVSAKPSDAHADVLTKLNSVGEY